MGSSASPQSNQNPGEFFVQVQLDAFGGLSCNTSHLGPISPLQPIASFNFPVSSKENAHLPATALGPEVGECKLKVPQGEQLLPVNWPAIVDTILDIGPVGKELSSHLQSVTATWFNTGSLCEDIPPLYIIIILMQDLMK